MGNMVWRPYSRNPAPNMADVEEYEDSETPRDRFGYVYREVGESGKNVFQARLDELSHPYAFKRNLTREEAKAWVEDQYRNGWEGYANRADHRPK